MLKNKKFENEKAPIEMEKVRIHFLEHYRLKAEQIDGLFNALRKTLLKCLKEADEALENVNMKLLHKSAHGIKGVLLNLGRDDLAEQARQIELSAKSEKDILPDNVSKIQTLYQNKFNSLKDLIKPFISR